MKNNIHARLDHLQTLVCVEENLLNIYELILNHELNARERTNLCADMVFTHKIYHQHIQQEFKQLFAEIE